MALASLQFGACVILGKLLEQGGLPVSTILVLRFAIAAVILAVVLRASGRPVPPVREERVPLALLGIVGYALESSLFFLALAHGTAGAVALLFFTYPALVALGSLILGRGVPGKVVVFSLLLALAGAAIVASVSGPVSIEPSGVALVAVSAIAYTVYLLGVESVMKRSAPLSGSMWVCGFAALGLAAVGALTTTLAVPDGPTQWVQVVALGAATGGAIACLFGGLQRIGTVRTSVVAALEPVAAVFLAVVFLGEAIGIGVALGGMLILVGAVLASVSTQEESPARGALP